MWPSMFGPGWPWGVLVVLALVALMGVVALLGRAVGTAARDVWDAPRRPLAPVRGRRPYPPGVRAPAPPARRLREAP